MNGSQGVERRRAVDVTGLAELPPGIVRSIAASQLAEAAEAGTTLPTMARIDVVWALARRRRCGFNPYASLGLILCLLLVLSGRPCWERPVCAAEFEAAGLPKLGEPPPSALPRSPRAPAL